MVVEATPYEHLPFFYSDRHLIAEPGPFKPEELRGKLPELSP